MTNTEYKRKLIDIIYIFCSIISELLILTKQKLRRNFDIFIGKTPCPSPDMRRDQSITKRCENQCYPPLSMRGQGVLSDIYPWKNEIIDYSRILANSLFLLYGKELYCAVKVHWVGG